MQYIGKRQTENKMESLRKQSIRMKNVKKQNDIFGGPALRWNH